MPKGPQRQPPEGYLIAPSPRGHLVLRRLRLPGITVRHHAWIEAAGPFTRRWYALQVAERLAKVAAAESEATGK